MNFRDIFDSIEEITNELERSGMFVQGFNFDGQTPFSQKQNLRPREMMLKEPKVSRDISSQNDLQYGSTNSPSGHFYSSGSMQYQTITRNPDGSETILSKTVKNGKTTEKETIRKDGKIISEHEISSNSGGKKFK